MRSVLPALAVLLSVGAQARPVNIVISGPHSPNLLYGPADMLCDLNTCRLFNLPKETGLPPDAIVEFGLPQLGGQDRVDIRRCFQICRASVVGYETNQKTPSEHGNPTVAISPIELHLQ